MRVLTALAVGIVAFCCSGMYAEQEEGPANVQDKCGDMKWHGNNGHSCRLWRWRGPTGPMGSEGPAGQDSTIPGPQGSVGDKGNPGPAGIVEETSYAESLMNFARVSSNFPEVIGVLQADPGFGFTVAHNPIGGPDSQPKFLVNNNLPFHPVPETFPVYTVDGQSFAVGWSIEMPNIGSPRLYEVDLDLDALTDKTVPQLVVLGLGNENFTKIVYFTTFFTPIVLPGLIGNPSYYGLVGSRRFIIKAPQTDISGETLKWLGVGGVELARKGADVVRVTIRDIGPAPVVTP